MKTASPVSSLTLAPAYSIERRVATARALVRVADLALRQITRGLDREGEDLLEGARLSLWQALDVLRIEAASGGDGLHGFRSERERVQ
jgi:hypothetical protein